MNLMRTEHATRFLELQERLGPTRIREIEAQESHAAELRRHTEALEEQRRANNPLKQAIDQKFAQQFLPKPLNIVVGNGGSFERVKPN
jgi:hypothetical protein